MIVALLFCVTYASIVAVVDAAGERSVAEFERISAEVEAERTGAGRVVAWVVAGIEAEIAAEIAAERIVGSIEGEVYWARERRRESNLMMGCAPWLA